MTRKFILTIFLLILSASCFSQSNDTYFLRWKLKPHEVLFYDTRMEEIDTANHKDFSMDGMDKLISGDSATSRDKKIMKLFNQGFSNAGFITSLKENRKNIIDIEISAKKDTGRVAREDTSEEARAFNRIKSMMKNANGGVLLRGAVYEDGKIESFYTKNDQKNFIAMLFELPGKSVKAGDHWSLDIHLISMDESFVCDTSFKKNDVELIGIENKNGEHIVTLQYDIAEFVQGDFHSPVNNQTVKSMMKFTYKAIADFSVEKGRWINYNGIMSLSSSGIMTSQTTKQFSLVAN